MVGSEICISASRLRPSISPPWLSPSLRDVLVYARSCLHHPLFRTGVHEFIEESAPFPNGAQAEQVDAMTQALLGWNMIARQPVVYFNEAEYEPLTQISPI